MMCRCVTVAVLAFLVGCNASTPTVSVSGETLVGKYLGNGKVAAFLGVPFAEPPVGNLRWRAPQPLATKLERREVVEFAPACMQSMRILDWYRYMAELFGTSGDYYDDLEISEDCLYLNIWTTQRASDTQLPVMVWIHGGSNRSGWSYEPNYHGHALAEQGVVVVSIPYRTGAFGFLSHPELNPDEPMANFGLWDSVAALRWIQNNIEQFGGDPDRVTLFGESSGAQDILALTFAEPARGLFHRVILESTAGFGIDRMATLADEQQRGIDLAKILGFEGNGSLENLRQVPAQELLRRYEDAFSGYYHSPAVDGQLLTSPTWENIEADNFGDIQMIAGTNRDEWLDNIAADATMKDVVRTAENLSHMDANRALAAVADETDPRRAMDRLITANNYVCGLQYAANKLASSGQGSWLYYFTRAREDDAGAKLGAYHGAEYPYIFNTHDSYMTTTDVDVRLTNTMMTYWTQFAATGNPNSGGVPEWPEFNAPDHAVQELGDQIVTIPAPEPVLCGLFNEWAAERKFR